MSALRTVLLIAEREIRQRLRSKLFTWTTVAISVLLTGLAVLPVLLGAFDRDEGTVAESPAPVALAVVGELTAAQRDAVLSVLGAADEQRVADVAAAEALLVDGAAQLAVVPGQRVMIPPSNSLLQLGSAQANALAEALALADVLVTAGIDEQLAEVLRVPPLAVEAVGEHDPVEATGRLIVANVGVVFLFAVLMMYSSMIINGVIEEKGSRVVELLIEAVPARQLMAGKLLGLGAVGLGQTLVLFAPPTAVLLLTAGDLVPPQLGASSGLIVLWFVLGYALYSVMAAGLGALVSRPEEAQAVLTPANLLMVTGYGIGFVSINAPDAAFARAMALFPPTAPYVMPVRQILGDPSRFEVLLSIVLMLIAITLLTALAARIYRGGILQTGARVRLRDAWSSAGG